MSMVETGDVVKESMLQKVVSVAEVEISARGLTCESMIVGLT